jgi:hypothetical protein
MSIDPRAESRPSRSMTVSDTSGSAPSAWAHHSARKRSGDLLSYQSHQNLGPSSTIRIGWKCHAIEWRVVGDGDASRARDAAPDRPGLERAGDRDRNHGDSGGKSDPERAWAEGPEAPVRRAATLRKDDERLAPLEDPESPPNGWAVLLGFLNRKGSSPSHERPQSPDPKERLECHVVERAVDRYRHEDRIHERDVVRRDDDPAHARDVLDALESDAEQPASSRPHTRPQHFEKPEGNRTHGLIVARGLRP